MRLILERGPESAEDNAVDVASGAPGSKPDALLAKLTEVGDAPPAPLGPPEQFPPALEERGEDDKAGDTDEESSLDSGPPPLIQREDSSSDEEDKDIEPGVLHHLFDSGGTVYQTKQPTRFAPAKATPRVRFVADRAPLRTDAPVVAQLDFAQLKLMAAEPPDEGESHSATEAEGRAVYMSSIGIAQAYLYVPLVEGVDDGLLGRPKSRPDEDDDNLPHAW